MPRSRAGPVARLQCFSRLTLEEHPRQVGAYRCQILSALQYRIYECGKGAQPIARLPGCISPIDFALIARQPAARANFMSFARCADAKDLSGLARAEVRCEMHLRLRAARAGNLGANGGRKRAT